MDLALATTHIAQVHFDHDIAKFLKFDYLNDRNQNKAIQPSVHLVFLTNKQNKIWGLLYL